MRSGVRSGGHRTERPSDVLPHELIDAVNGLPCELDELSTMNELANTYEKGERAYLRQGWGQARGQGHG